jgi:hypothetical protein
LWNFVLQWNYKNVYPSVIYLKCCEINYISYFLLVAWKSLLTAKVQTASIGTLYVTSKVDTDNTNEAEL